MENIIPHTILRYAGDAFPEDAIYRLDIYQDIRFHGHAPIPISIEIEP